MAQKQVPMFRLDGLPSNPPGEKVRALLRKF